MKKSLAVRLVAYTIYIVFLVLLIEAGSRIFLAKKMPSVTFINLSGFIDSYYPNLKAIETNSPNKDDGVFDILLLGGSVLHPNNGEIEEELNKQLTALNKHTPFKIHNAATPAHTSRDSKLKMDLLSQHHFDLILFYHGINDTRANNCKPEVFKKDYSHFKWYDEIEGIMKRPKKDWTAIPIAFNYLKIDIYQRLFPRRYIPRGYPRNGWTEYGEEVKTKASFKAHIRSILNHAESMNSKLVVPSFTYWIDDRYSKEFFEKNKDRDERARMPVEIWGKPPYVIKGIEAHNSVILTMAKENDNLMYIDMHSKMPKGDLFYDDICHLSQEGSIRFAKIIVAQISKEIK